MTNTEKTNAMDQLTYWTTKRDDADKGIATWVRAAKQAGATWQAIGDVLGVTKQRAQQKYAALAAEPDRYTCNCGWSHIIPRDAAGCTRETAVVLAHIKTEHPEIGAKIRQERAERAGDPPADMLAAEATLTSEDTGHGELVTPSIFSDTPAPAKPKTKAKKVDVTAPARNTAGSFRRRFLIADPDKTAQPGTGKSPHQCPACQDTNHKTSDYGQAAFTPDCIPTKYDPPKIAALIQEKTK